MSELNLLPGHVKQKKILRLIIMKWSITGVLIIAVLGLVAYLPYARLKRLQRDEVSLKQTLESQQNIKPDNDRLLREAAVLRGFITKIDFIKETKVSAHPIIKKLEGHLPQDVVLDSFTYSGASINFSGKATSYNSVYELLANLQETTEFRSSTISSVTKGETVDEWKFILSIAEVRGETNESSK
jgi:Tfp pilus assembly protein PilN